MGGRTGKRPVYPSSTSSLPALRGCPLPGKVLSATCVRHAVPHFILTTLMSVFLRLFTGEETEAERGDTPGGRRLGGAVAEFRRPNSLPSLDSLPPQPFVGGVLTHPFPLPSCRALPESSRGVRTREDWIHSLTWPGATHGLCSLEQVTSLGLDGLVWKQGYVTSFAELFGKLEERGKAGRFATEALDTGHSGSHLGSSAQ